MRVYMSAVLLLFGCDLGHSHDAAVPKPEVEAVQETRWTDRFEIFQEHPPLQPGVPATFAVHVTDLSTHQPRREGKLVAQMRLGDDPPIEVTVEAPKRPGIYSPQLTFPKPGTWRLTFKIPVESAVHEVEVSPLFVGGAGEPPPAPDGIAFLKEQQWTIGSRVEPAAPRPMIERFRVAGVVTAKPGSRAHVSPPLAGRLLAAPGRALPSPGDRVEAGQTLALLQPVISDMAAKLAEARVQVAKAALAEKQARLTLERVRTLAAGQAKTARELQEAEFAHETARAEYEAAVALRTAYESAGALFVPGAGLPALELKAPIAGTVTRLNAAVGEFVFPDTPVLSLLDSSTVFVEAKIPEADLARVGAPTTASYVLPDARGQHVPIPGGRFVHQGLEVDPVTRTVSHLYELPNPEGRLKIGLALTLYLGSGAPQEFLAVPESAVVEEEGRPVAFVQIAGETFEKRPLTLGIRDSGWVQVREGLAAGDRVVTREAYAVRLASVSSSIPAHGHEH